MSKIFSIWTKKFLLISLFCLGLKPGSDLVLWISWHQNFLKFLKLKNHSNRTQRKNFILCMLKFKFRIFEKLPQFQNYTLWNSVFVPGIIFWSQIHQRLTLLWSLLFLSVLIFETEGSRCSNLDGKLFLFFNSTAIFAWKNEF